MKNKKGKKLNSINFGFTEKSDVFINHDLTTENQSLYKKTRDFKKQENYKFAWVSHEGKIFLRKSDTSKILNITSEEVLKKLTKN